MTDFLNREQEVSKKGLNVFAIVMINIIAVDSLRTLPFGAEYGLSLVFYYLIAAVAFFLPVAFVSAELATGWPNRGGIYIWVREAFGERWGFFVIWLQWVYNVVWYPTILSFVAATLAYLIDPRLATDKTYMLITVLSIFWLSSLINCFGMKWSSAISTFGALFGTLIPMVFIVFLEIFWLLKGYPTQVQFSWSHLIPTFHGLNELSFLTAILFGLIGMELSAVHADEVQNPGKAYPRAILYSSIIILTTLIFSSLAIAVVVPKHELNIVTGLVQAFQMFFDRAHLSYLGPVVDILIIIGGISGVATWIIGPTKGLMVATQDGSAPPVFALSTSKGVPIMMLFLQAMIFTLISLLFLLMPTVSSSYWLLTVMTAQLAMLVYLFMFAAAIYLRYKKPEVARDYKVPVGNFGMWITVLLGIASCLFAVVLGFFPPPNIKVGSLMRYEVILVAGIVLLSAPPLIIYAFRKPSWRSAL